MDILVFSDSHGEIELMANIVQEISPDLIVHLGDHEKDAKALSLRFPDIPLHRVRGNCDFLSKTSELEEVVVAEKKIILTHGHRYHVKESYNALYNMGHFAEADLVLFGHTHIPHYEQVNNMHVLNPGSARDSCSIVQIQDGEIRCKHLRLL